MAGARSRKTCIKKCISIRNFELKFGMLDYWPSTFTKSKKHENVKISSQ